jgi:hypothetical protein
LAFVIVFLENILIFPNSEEEHIKHLRTMLSILRKNKLYSHPCKSEPFRHKISYLGHIISAVGKVAADPEKLKTITEWPKPRQIRDVQAFLGLVNLYRKLVRRVSEIARPPHDLLQKEKPFRVRLD